MPSTLNACDPCLNGLWELHALALPPPPCHHVGMDTSTTPRISPRLEPETMTALMLRYVEGEEVASRIDVALRRLIDRIEADEAFMAELIKRDEWGL